MQKMKKKLLVLLMVLCALYGKLLAQDFIGFNTNPYAGVSAVDLQPASIAGTVYKSDINIVGASLFAHNNYLRFKPKPFWEWKFENATETNTAGKLTNVYAQTRVQLPSAMVDINQNSAVALTLQARAMVQGENIEPQIAKEIYEDYNYTPYHDKTYTAANPRVRALAWTEIGLSYAHLFYFSGGHRIKVGARVKFLGGLKGLFLNTTNSEYQFNPNQTIDVNGNFNYGHSADFDKYKINAASVGLDFGVKYSYANRFVVGASLLDVGKIKFTKDAQSGNFIMNTTNLSLEGIDKIQELDDTLAARAVVNTTSDREFSITLPRAFSLQFTAYLWESGDFEGGGYHNFYINVATYNSISGSNDKGDALKAVNTYTITPGFNTISMAAGIPVTYSQLSGVTIGGFVRLGPFVAGSKNFISHFLKKNAAEADVYVALKVPLLKPRPRLVQGCPKHF